MAGGVFTAFTPIVKAHFWVPSGPCQGQPGRDQGGGHHRSQRHQPQMPRQEPATSFHNPLLLVSSDESKKGPEIIRSLFI
jgi:hypothetical protein